MKVDRIGKVTIYKRGTVFYLYYREEKQSVRRRVDGNLYVARATAAKVGAALEEGRTSPLGFQRATPNELAEGFLDYVANVQQLAWRTQDRYRAALDRFRDFCDANSVCAADAIDVIAVEDFVRWLRSQKRTRNGAASGNQSHYKVGGVKFILSTCRTVFNWAARRRMLPPYADNPFTRFPIDQLRDASAEDEGQRVFTPKQEADFFSACSDWQRSLFLTLATYGLRVGELAHLLVEDIDFQSGVIHIRSKPETYWHVTTARRRQIPLTNETATLSKKLVGRRKAGFVFLNEQFFLGAKHAIETFDSPEAFRDRLKGVAAQYGAEKPEATDREKRRVVVAFCRKMGQIPEKRIRGEFIKLTQRIGCPEFTRAHDLRHLFSSRAQENGINPLLVQEILGHATLEMTKRYTHLGMDTKRAEIERLEAQSRRSNETTD